MPIYKNETEVNQKFIVKDKNINSIEPGGEINTKYFTSNTALTLVSETPYYNRLAAVDKITSLSTTPQEVSIDGDTNYIMVTQITNVVTVYRQAVINTPPQFLDWESVSPIIPIDSDGTFTKLVFTGSGECTVYQYK